MNKTINDYVDLSDCLIITPDDEGRHDVEVARLPGCVTYAQYREDIPIIEREVMTTWIGSTLKHNDPFPESSVVMV